MAPLHMASVGVTQRGIGLIYSIGAVLGAGVLFLLAQIHRSERRPAIAIAACSLAAIMTAALALPLSRRTFVEIVVILGADSSRPCTRSRIR